MIWNPNCQENKNLILASRYVKHGKTSNQRHVGFIVIRVESNLGDDVAAGAATAWWHKICIQSLHNISWVEKGKICFNIRCNNIDTCNIIYTKLIIGKVKEIRSHRVSVQLQLTRVVVGLQWLLRCEELQPDSGRWTAPACTKCRKVEKCQEKSHKDCYDYYDY